MNKRWNKLAYDSYAKDLIFFYEDGSILYAPLVNAKQFFKSPTVGAVIDEIIATDDIEFKVVCTGVFFDPVSALCETDDLVPLTKISKNEWKTTHFKRDYNLKCDYLVYVFTSGVRLRVPVSYLLQAKDTWLKEQEKEQEKELGKKLTRKNLKEMIADISNGTIFDDRPDDVSFLQSWRVLKKPALEKLLDNFLVGQPK